MVEEEVFHAVLGRNPPPLIVARTSAKITIYITDGVRIGIGNVHGVMTAEGK
jgi:hypothetical protein